MSPEPAIRADEWAARASAVLPAGGLGNFDPAAIIARGSGSRVWDVEGREYVDLLIGSGPMLLGHDCEEVLDAVREALPRGQTFFATNPHAIELAEVIVDAVPCAEAVRFVASGGEADMYAIRLARAFTGRPKIVKFEGGYHGMSPEAQMSLMPTRASNFPQPIPDSAGIPRGVADEVLVAPFNDEAFIRSLFAEHGHEIAGLIVEPLQRIVPPEPGFLEALRTICDEHGAVLIFDEIVTGFRLAYGGAQEHYGVTPDLATLGKIIGGGFPLAATAGRADIMAHFDKAAVGEDRWLMQLGTLSGNPIAAVAGLKTMEVLRRPGQYERLRANGQAIRDATRDALDAAGVPYAIIGDPTLFEVVFTERDVRNYRDTIEVHHERTDAYQSALRANGVFKAPGKTYPSLALTGADIERVNDAVRAAANAVGMR